MYDLFFPTVKTDTYGLDQIKSYLKELVAFLVRQSLELDFQSQAYAYLKDPLLALSKIAGIPILIIVLMKCNVIQVP